MIFQLQIFGDLDAPYGLSLTPDFPMDGGKRMDGECSLHVLYKTRIRQIRFITISFVLHTHSDPSGCELMTYQPNTSHVDLSQLLGDSSNNPKKGKVLIVPHSNHMLNRIRSPPTDDDGNDEHQPMDYLDHDLNTPNVERKNVPFQYRH